MIAIIDYGVGNLFSLSSSLSYLGLEASVTSDPEAIKKADRLILPGVGAFADAKRKLDSTGLCDIVKEEAKSGKPLLGICLGMQLLFDRSLEFGECEGLRLIPGTVAPIKEDITCPVKIPHMGWNSLDVVKDSTIFRYTPPGEYVYYVHSFYAKDCGKSIIATSDYGGIKITGAVQSQNVFGTQFHPEKSGDAGLRMLKAFCEL